MFDPGQKSQQNSQKQMRETQERQQQIRQQNMKMAAWQESKEKKQQEIKSARPGKKGNIVNIILLIIGLGIVLFGLFLGSEGMFGPFEVLLIALGVILIVIFALRSRRREKIRRHVVGEYGRIGEVDIPREKSVVIAYIFWLPMTMGFFGAYRYYLGKYGTAILYTFTASILGIGWVIDAFRLPKITRDTNRRLWEDWFAKQSDQWEDISGTVRDYTMSSQSDMAGQVVTPKQVMNFRIEETDEQGDIIRMVEVELIGNRISGNLRNGDAVEVRGKMSQESILRALTVENKTTNSRVTVAF